VSQLSELLPLARLLQQGSLASVQTKECRAVPQARIPALLVRWRASTVFLAILVGQQLLQPLLRPAKTGTTATLPLPLSR